MLTIICAAFALYCAVLSVVRTYRLRLAQRVISLLAQQLAEATIDRERLQVTADMLRVRLLRRTVTEDRPRGVDFPLT